MRFFSLCRLSVFVGYESKLDLSPNWVMTLGFQFFAFDLKLHHIFSRIFCYIGLCIGTHLGLGFFWSLGRNNKYVDWVQL